MNARSKAGFTLVELMVVAIIVAILAAVAIPLMSANKRRAMATEGEAGLGMMRTAMRVYFAEHSTYPASGDFSTTNLPGVLASDLDGKYFVHTDYSWTTQPPSNYTLTVDGSIGDMADVVISLDQAGNFVRTGL